nr:hypothetical protein [uncultured Sphingosinicella sp.]
MRLRISRKAGFNLVAVLLLIAPFPFLLAGNAYALVAGGGLEPLDDNLLMYLLLVIMLGAAALPISSYFLWKNVSVLKFRDTLTYAFVGGIGSASLLVLADAFDSSFSPPGVGWHLPTFGFLSGMMFGAAFRASCGLLTTHRIWPNG